VRARGVKSPEASPSFERHGVLRSGLLRVLFLSYLCCVAYVTLAPRSGTSGSLTSNLVPLKTIGPMLSSGVGNRLVLRNIGGNLALLAPLGVFLMNVWPRYPFRRSLLVVVVASASIEIVQATGLVAGRGFDVDDVILNTTGALTVTLIVSRLITVAGDGRLASGTCRAAPPSEG